MLRFALSLLLVTVAALAACNGSTSAEEAAAAGGTPAPDGAPGYCCPARTGGCGLTGGYRESEPCPTDWDICDGMCAQRIEKDEHGCDALRYTPCAPYRPDAGASPGADRDATPDAAADAS